MLASLTEVCAIAEQKKSAVGSFNTPNSESLWAVIDAAETLNVPVIIAHAQCHDYAAPLDRIAPLMMTAARNAKVPVCVHLDHGEDPDYCARAIGYGFTSVMIDHSALPYEENLRGTKLVVQAAHAAGADVEAELGALPSRESGAQSAVRIEDTYTDPGLVGDFLEMTGADALAIAFGTAHGIYKSRPVLNTGIIRAVRGVTRVPLVMHGGSGVSDEQYREVIACGITKINYYTYMACAGSQAAQKYLADHGAGCYHDLAQAAQNAMYDKVLAAMKTFWSL